MRFYEVHVWVLLVAYHRLTISYALDLSFPNRKRLEVFKNVKYIAVASRNSKLDSKLPVFDAKQILTAGQFGAP